MQLKRMVATSLFAFLGVTLLVFYKPSWASAGPTEDSPWSLIFKFVNLAIFVAVIYKLGAKATKAHLRGRREKVRRAIEDAARQEEEARKVLEVWEKRTGEAEEEARRIIEAASLEGKDLREKVLREAEEEAKRILEQAQVRANEEIKKARQALGRELAAISCARAEELFRENLNEDLHKKLIEEGLRGMEDFS